MTTHDLSRNETQQLLLWLDEAIDDYDRANETVRTLEGVLRAIAEVTSESDPQFSERALRVAERAKIATDPSERDIASVLARDVRRDLMCTSARAFQTRNHCVPAANRARSLQAMSRRKPGIRYLGD